MDIQGRSVLVTGAGRGLGAATVRVLGRAGARVVGVARTGSELEATVEAARAEGSEAHALVGDLGVKEDIHRIAGAAAGMVGPIEVLIHNASALGPVPLRPLLDTECEDFEAVLRTNLLGPFRLTRALAGHMALAGRGLVVHLSSDAAVEAYPGWGAYGVSKAALDHLARIWAVELADEGVRFVSVDPGEMDTRMHAEALPEADPATLGRPEQVAERLVALIRGVEALAPGARVSLGGGS